VSRLLAGAGDLLLRFPCLPASALLRSDRFVRRQDSGAQWMGAEQCWLLIFVSHRWETRRHPDPCGRQHRAVTRLVSDLCDLWDGLGAEDARERIRLVPRLDQHGMAQAAVLLSRLDLPGSISEQNRGQSARDFLPEHIGIWYDYACLPQEPRSPAEEAEFRAGMLALPELFGSQAVTLVALRESGDDYRNRAWCLAEALLTANKAGSQGVAVRMDLAGTTLELRTEGQESNLDLSRRLRAALDGWADVASDAAAAANCLTMLAVIAGHAPSEWFSPSDGIAPVYLGDVVSIAGVWLGSVLALLGRQQGRPVDLATVLREVAERADVRCAIENDLVFVTLLMLHGESAPQTAIRAFYQQCMERHLSGRPLVVRPIIEPGRMLSYEDLRLTFE
jgi:hypothetical protein